MNFASYEESTRQSRAGLILFIADICHQSDRCNNVNLKLEEEEGVRQLVVTFLTGEGVINIAHNSQRVTPPLMRLY